MTATEIAERVQDYMDQEGIKYEYTPDNERPKIQTGFEVSCKLQSVKILILFNEDGYSALGVCPISADEESRADVMDYLTRANYGLRNGNFELDLRDGEIRYKTYVCCYGMEPEYLTDEVIERSIFMIPSMFKKYGNGIAAIAMGFSDPITEIEKAEG